MMNRSIAVVIALLAAAVTGCMTVPVDDSAATSEATSELTAGQTCFTCVLDESVHACSSIASAARWRCERACIVCDDFGDNIGECFRGPCEPDL